MREHPLFQIAIVQLVLASVSLCSAAPHVEVRPLAIGKPLPEFDLPGVDGRRYTPRNFAAARLLVVVFTCNHCPTAQAYEAKIIQLFDDYRDRGVTLVAVSPNDPRAVRLDELGFTDMGDSLKEMRLRAAQRGFQFPYLYDGDSQKFSHAMGVLATPHVFIFDSHRKLRYQGRIDNSERGPVNSSDTRNALDALLAGRSVPVATTRVFGCSTKWSYKRKSARDALEKWNAEPVAIEPSTAREIRAIASNPTDKFHLINVWSTTCAPCVAEMPELVTINRMYRQRPFELITLCTDTPEQQQTALRILRQKHVSCRNLIYSGTDLDTLAEALDPHWQGPVPYTVLIAPGGKIVFRQPDQIEPLNLKRIIVEHLGRTYASRQ